ncbi:Anaerobic dimethyl sulfoxide reductase chain C [Rubellimicrobium mesophilum DSM 19309]|uniref:Anaerobic dimethyl sulfoxide reductase chain C n=1 Tax=Rubellimicrobium mesophilum DSM 19309 TaxID=442562 RepID=A0A017HVJ1_9RHOB|nr:DmsC/YnfH family molybdoenzyme membrane anchor subunit [Rubellimicrobium mesophilum]EYD78163.1 Anaerobic dimethyl sulfoxide reductase chain C [Rubellimicrobium mesophilum DSM 19309]
MHPAPSLILFSSLTGLGLGLLAWLAVLGLASPPLWALGLVLAGAGFLASTRHLRRPSRAILAFTQWRTSWLSREAILAILALATLTLHGALLILRDQSPALLGALAAAIALTTVLATSMIYAQLRSVPRWHHWSTPALFLALGLAGGALLAAPRPVALAFLATALVLQLLHWHQGRTAFARAGSTLSTATGLKGEVRSFAPPHTGPNYLLREMVHVVARRRAAQLRLLTILLAFALPALLLVPDLRLLAAATHLAGVLCSRWLFFAEAEHTVGLYYGAR